MPTDQLMERVMAMPQVLAWNVAWLGLILTVAWIATVLVERWKSGE